VPWVVGVARNVLRASRRRSRVEDRARRRLGLVPIELDDADLERVRALEDSENSRVTELLGQLPEDERTAVRARIVDEHSYTEIATALRCSEMVARKRVSRGLARMRARLQERP
jgi:RNA polymerase sigma-70 factor (ECF subfamily)